MSSVDRVLSGEVLFEQPLACSHKICDVYCDMDWSTKWLSDDGDSWSVVPAHEWDGVSGRHPWAEMTFETAMHPEYMAVVWTPTLPCNYTCTYCGCAAGRKKVLKEFPSSHPELPSQQWVEFFRELLKRYPYGYLQTNGGEPMLSDATIPVLKLLAEHWSLNLVTNGSMKIMELVRLGMPAFRDDSEYGLSVTLSLHPTSARFNWEIFLGRALMLHHEGYLRCVNFVGWPEQLYLFEHYKDILASYGIEMLLQPWMGEDNQGRSGYSDREKIFVGKHTEKSRNNHTLVLGAYAAKADYSAQVTASSIEVSGDQLVVELNVVNSGSHDWDDPEIKMGCRIFPSIAGSRNILREYRFANPTFSPGASGTQTIELDLAGIEDHDLVLDLDLVFEKKFWFSDQGDPSLRIFAKQTDAGWDAMVASANSVPPVY